VNALVKPCESVLPEIVARENITALKEFMLALPESERLPFDNRHDFCPGLYARTIFMPAGMVAISRIHKTQHFFVVVKGSCTVIDSHGNKLLIEAPYLGVTMPGTERALHIHEDCIWTTFHPTDLTDPEEIGKQILADSLIELEKSL
jgi:hypothetical protein